MLGVDRSILAPQSAIQEVGSVKLDPRLGGVYFQDPPTSGMTHPGDKDKPYFSGEGKGLELALGWESDLATQREQEGCGREERRFWKRHRGGMSFKDLQKQLLR